MTTLNKFNSFVANLANGKYNLGSDQLTVALCASANAPVATNIKLSDLTVVAYANLSTRNITTTSSTQTSGTYKLIVQDLVLTASGTVATWRYAVIYDSNATNYELIGWIDSGGDITMLANDTFTLDFDNVNGLLQLA